MHVFGNKTRNCGVPSTFNCQEHRKFDYSNEKISVRQIRKNIENHAYFDVFRHGDTFFDYIFQQSGSKKVH